LKTLRPDHSNRAVWSICFTKEQVAIMMESNRWDETTALREARLAVNCRPSLLHLLSVNPEL